MVRLLTPASLASCPLLTRPAVSSLIFVMLAAPPRDVPPGHRGAREAKITMQTGPRRRSDPYPLSRAGPVITDRSRLGTSRGRILKALDAPPDRLSRRALA